MTTPVTEISWAAVSITSTSDKARNVAAALAGVREAAKNGAQWIQLPEMLAYMGTYDRVYEMAEEEGGPLFLSMSSLAKELGIILIGGSVGERPAAGEFTDAELKNKDGHRRVFNTSYIFGRAGEIIAKYRKIHLFNLSDANGKPLYCESDGYLGGKKAVTTEIDGWKVGMSICYDLRFPRLYDMIEAQTTPDVILAPSAFTKATGQFHWELLLRARAVERLAYVFATNQVGQHNPGATPAKESFGHGLIVDPWGKVLADTGDMPGIAYATVRYKAIAEARGKLSALSDRRSEIYSR